MTETRRFYLDTSGPDDGAVHEGWEWLLREVMDSDERIGWVAVNGLDVADRLARAIGPAASTLTSSRRVTGGGVSIGLITATAAKTPTWETGPVLAVWPSVPLLNRIEDRLHPPALCVIPWVPGELDYWVTGHRPTELRSGQSAADSPALSNRVLEAALESLTLTSSFGSGPINLRDFRERAAAIQVFRILHDGREHFDPSEIVPWALAHGWDAAAARELENIARQTQSGKRLRGSPGAGIRWKPDALEEWRRQAADKTQQK
jgi:hypothetical protein